MAGAGHPAGIFDSDHGHIPLIAALLLAMLIGRVSATIAARRASRVHPTEALRDAMLPPRRMGVPRAVLGVVLALATAALLMVSVRVADSVGASVVAPLATSLLVVVALFAPMFTAGGVRTVGIAARPIGAAGYLATINSRSNAARMAAVVMPVVVLVTVAGMTLLQQATLTDELSVQGSERILADEVISSTGPGLPPSLVAEVAAIPGIDAAIGLLPTTIHAGPYQIAYPAQAITRGPIESVLDLDVSAGSLAHVTDDEVAISDALANDLDVEVGDLARFRLGDGASVDRRVVATYARDRGFGDALLAWDGVVGHVTDPVLHNIAIRSDSATQPSTRTRLQQLLLDHPLATMGDPDTFRASEQAEADARAWIGYMLFGMVLVFTAIALVNTFAMTIVARSREFALLRLLGTTPRQLRRMMCWEAAMIAAIGSVLGAAVAITTLAPFSIDVTGTWLPHIPWTMSVVVLTSVACLVWIATIVPTRIALRAQPIESVRVG